MASKDQLQKLQGHSESLLSAFLGLRLNYALLAPLIGDPSAQLRSPPRGQLLNGLSAMRHTLFCSCVLDVFKLVWDDDSRAPSIHNIVGALRNPDLISVLKANPPFPFVLNRESEDAAHEQSLQLIEAREREHRIIQIDDLRHEIEAAWQRLDQLAFKSAFLDIRDRHIAHLELRLMNGAYEPLDIGTLGVSWADLGHVVSSMDYIVVDVGRVLRDADFDMPHTVEMFERHGRNFWSWLRATAGPQPSV